MADSQSTTPTEPVPTGLDALREIYDMILNAPTANSITEPIRTLAHPNGITVEEDQSWQQGTWRNLIVVDTDDDPRCDTGLCLAGWGVELYGHTQNVRWAVSARDVALARIELDKATKAKHAAETEAKYILPRQHLAVVTYNEAKETYYGLLGDQEAIVTHEGERGTPMDWARNYFGLTHDQANAIFSGSNDIKTIGHYIEVLTEDPEADLRLYDLDDD